MLALTLFSRSFLERVRLGEIAVLQAVAQLHRDHAAQRAGRKRSAAHSPAAGFAPAHSDARQHCRRPQSDEDAQSPTINRASGMSSRVSIPISSPAGFTTGRLPTWLSS